MVSIGALWLPILVSAVVVFVASSIIHMALTYHRSDYRKLPEEDRIRGVLREAGLTPGVYTLPHCASNKEMSSPEMIAKMKEGPVGFLTVMRSGPPKMGKFLSQWFVYCIVVGIFAAYIAGRALGPGAEYLAVFRFVGTTAFLGYSASEAIDAIWMGQPWSATLKHMADGLVYALLTAGVFGWLWPS